MEVEIKNDAPDWSRVMHNKDCTQVIFHDWVSQKTEKPYIWMPTGNDIENLIIHYIIMEQESWGKDVRMALIRAIMRVPLEQMENELKC